MHNQRFLRASLLAVLGVLAALIVPAAAQATAKIRANCTGWHIDYTAWDDGADTSHVIAKLDGETTHDIMYPVTSDDQTLSGVWPDRIYDGNAHSIEVTHDWVEHAGDGDERLRATVTCEKRTPPPPPPPPPTTTTTTTPPTGTQPGISPAGGVLPETIASARAQLHGPSGCVKQAFRASVTGRGIAAVRFYVDGKLLKRVAGDRTRYSVKVNPRGLGLGRHRVVAHVRFDAATGAETRKLRLTFRRCARQAVQPRFTG